MVTVPETTAAAEPTSTLRPMVRFLLWDYERGSLVYEMAFVVVLSILLLVPGAFWGDPLWPVP